MKLHDINPLRLCGYCNSHTAKGGPCQWCGKSEEAPREPNARERRGDQLAPRRFT